MNEGVSRWIAGMWADESKQSGLYSPTLPTGNVRAGQF